MKTSTIKYSLFIAYIISFFVFLSITNAQTQNYTVLQPLPGIGDGQGAGGREVTLSQYIPAVFNLTVGVAIALAFIFITIGGITYATSDSLTGKEDGRNYIKNAVTGLLLVIGSYVILYTINPQILNFDINFIAARPQQSPTTTVTPVTPTGNCVGGGCLPFAGTGLPTEGRAVTSGVSASMKMPRLLQLHSILCPSNTLNGTCNLPWKISEGGYSPSVRHQSQCHNQGTCIDGGPISETPRNLNTFYESAASLGLYPVFEVETDVECFNLKSTTNRDGSPRRNPDGTPFVPYNGPILVLRPDPVTGERQITGPHFSVYNYNPQRGVRSCP